MRSQPHLLWVVHVTWLANWSAACGGRAPSVPGPPRPAPPVASKESSPVLKYKLPSGLNVLLYPSHAAPVVAFQAWVGVGSGDETPAEAGLAHVFEHMLFKGTARRGVGQIAKEVETAGGDINAWTSFDETVYHLVMSSRYFDTGLDILADAVRSSSFDPAELERERKVVLEEIKQGEDSPSRVLAQRLYREAYGDHPYGRPVIGTAQAVESHTREKLLGFFHKWYVPRNLTLVVAGDFEPDDARGKIAKAWGDWQGPPAEHDERPAPAAKGTRVVVLTKDVRESHIAMAVPIPGIRDADVAAYDVAALVLGQGDSSRLMVDVKRARRLASDAYAYSYTPRGPGLFVVGGSTSGDTDELARALLTETYRLAHEDVSPSELAKAKVLIESDAVYQKETVQGMARKLGYFEVTAGSTEYEREYLKQVADLTPARIRQAMARVLSPEKLTLAVVVEEGKDGAADGKKHAALEKGLRAAVGEEFERTAERYAPAPAPDNDAVVKRVLPSGATLIVKRDATVPVVAFRAVWVGGLLNEDDRTAGMSSFLATLLTRGTLGRSGDEISHEMEGMAGGIGGFSGKNSLGLRAEILSRHWERGLEIVAECLRRPTFPEEEVDKERRHVLDEIHAQEDNLSVAVMRLFSETMYRKHPYRLDPLGTPASVGGFTRDKVRDHFSRYYPLGGLTLSVVGDVDPARVVEKATGLLGGEAPRRPPPRPPRENVAARPRGPTEVFRFRSRQQAHMVIGFPGTTLDDPDHFALEVMSTVLSGQGGRLFIELRDKEGLAYRVNAYNLEGLDPGYFAVYIATSPTNLDKALDGIRVELARLVDTPVPADELERAKRYLVGAHDISLQRRAAVASSLAFNEAYGLGWDTYRRYAASIQAVDAAAVARVARKYLDWDRAVIATVKPEELTPAAEQRKKGVKKAPPKRSTKR